MDMINVSAKGLKSDYNFTFNGISPDPERWCNFGLEREVRRLYKENNFDKPYHFKFEPIHPEDVHPVSDVMIKRALYTIEINNYRDFIKEDHAHSDFAGLFASFGIGENIITALSFNVNKSSEAVYTIQDIDGSEYSVTFKQDTAEVIDKEEL